MIDTVQAELNTACLIGCNREKLRVLVQIVLVAYFFFPYAQQLCLFFMIVSIFLRKICLELFFFQRLQLLEFAVVNFLL